MLQLFAHACTQPQVAQDAPKRPPSCSSKVRKTLGPFIKNRLVDLCWGAFLADVTLVFAPFAEHCCNKNYKNSKNSNTIRQTSHIQVCTCLHTAPSGPTRPQEAPRRPPSCSAKMKKTLGPFVKKRYQASGWHAKTANVPKSQRLSAKVALRAQKPNVF